MGGYTALLYYINLRVFSLEDKETRAKVAAMNRDFQNAWNSSQIFLKATCDARQDFEELAKSIRKTHPDKEFVPRRILLTFSLLSALKLAETYIHDLWYWVFLERHDLGRDVIWVLGGLDPFIVPDRLHKLRAKHLSDPKIQKFIIKYGEGTWFRDEQSWVEEKTEWLEEIGNWDAKEIMRQVKANGEAWKKENRELYLYAKGVKPF